MLWKKVRHTSLQWRLLALIVPAMIAFSVIELLETDRYSAQTINSAYDRSLLGVIKSINNNVSTASGGLSVELPYHLFELFQLTADGSVHFRVATADGLVEIGSPDLPPPPAELRAEQPIFYDAAYFGESVRVGAYLRELDRPLTAQGAQRLIIQVSESTRSRAEFTRRFVISSAARDLLILSAMIVSVAAAVSYALRPVLRLAAQVRNREPSDLNPLAVDDLPADIQLLVDAVNQQIVRTRNLVVQQRHFIDDASHQLRTSLATLRTQVDYAQRHMNLQQVQQTLAAMSQQLDHATRSTNQLLALARSDMAVLQVETFDLAALVREIIIFLLPNARAKHLDMGFEESEESLISQGDTALLREAITNLVENAVRYTPIGGQITVSVGSVPEGHVVAVVDNGPGVGSDVLSTLGQRFVRGRTRRPESGSGLGLAIARSIAERHGGGLKLEAGPEDRGLRAVLWWPTRKNGESASSVALEFHE